MKKRTASRFRKFATASIAAMAACALAPQASATEAEGKKPNVLLVILDDVGIDTMSNMYPGLIDGLVQHYGPQGLNHPDYARIKGGPASTPVIDALSQKGVVFTNAWAQPFCSPTRASLLTGLNAAKTGMRDYTNWLSQNHRSLAMDLKQAGYATAIFGKWHMAGLNQYPGMKPREAGFDLFKGNLNGAIYDYWNYDYQVQDGSTPDSEWVQTKPPVKSLPGIAPTTYAPVVKVADTIDWIAGQEKANPDKPWFAWLAFNLAHITEGRFPNPTMIPNEDTLDQVSRDEMAACGGQFGTTKIGDCKAGALNRAMTNSIDTVVGKLLDAVGKMDPNTYVIVLGDNGTPMYGQPGINFIDNMYITRDGRAKGTAYESGMRIPLAIVGPGIQPGSSDAVTHVVDLFSTIHDLAGIQTPARVPNKDGSGTVTVDGVSLSPVLFDHKASIRDPNLGYIVGETVIPLSQNEHQIGLRNATYKVLCKDREGVETCQFFNLVNDPLEEFPLTPPASCDAKAAVVSSDPDANYCYLRDRLEAEKKL